MCAASVNRNKISLFNYFRLMEHQSPADSQLSTDGLNLAEQKQAILSSIVTASDDAIISKSLAGIITSWNPAAERMFGYSEDFAVGRDISLIIPLDRLDEEKHIISEISKGNRIKHFQTIRISKEGRFVPISLSVSPVFNANGQVIGASKIARDITEYQEAAEKQGVLAAIVDSSDDMILSKTLEGVIKSWNKAAEKMFGYTEEEAIGQHISLIIPKDRLSEEQYIIGEVIKGNKVDHFETIRAAKSGMLIPISVSVSPIYDYRGKIIGASKIARDISAQMLAKQENDRLYEQVKSLNVKKDEFIGMASHELKTPLTSIQGYLDILARKITDEKCQNYLQKSRHQLTRVHTLIAELLDVSKIEAGKLPLHYVRFDLCQLAADVVEMLLNSNDQFKIVLDCAENEVLITADSHRIEQVITNLLTNAIRYSGDSKQITVHLKADLDQVIMGVQDFGIGIPADKLNDIFTKFFRVGNHSAEISGLGIGLYLSQEIVDRHQGRFWVESELEKGSTFWFSLPVHPPLDAL
jgi:PAS domain S-box-containing protein